MKKIQQFLFIVLVTLLSVSFGSAQKNITKPNVSGPNGLSVNTYTGGLFYQRQDLFIPGRGLSIDVTFSYNTVSRDRDWGMGRGWTFTYNMAYSFDTLDVVVEHMDGSRRRYLPDGSGGWSSPAGVFDTLEQYQANQYRLTTREGMKYFFDDPTHKKLTSIEDRNGNAITLSYTDSLLTTITDPSGRNVNLTWTNGRLAKITDPNTTPPREWHYAYDSQGNPVMVTDPLTNFTQYEYDDQHKITVVTNKNGYPANIEYNALDAVQTLISCVGKQRFTYSYETLKTYVVEPVGGKSQVTVYEYDDQGRLVKQTGNCCGYNVQFEYDEDNNVTRRIDANGNATTFVYDDFGNLLQETDPLGHTMSWTYEYTYHQVVSETDRNGNTATYNYDSNGNLIQVQKPMGISESYTYDALGNLLTYTDGRSNITTYTYDIDGNVLTMVDPEGGLTSFAYDEISNTISITNPNSSTSSIEYDFLNRIITVTNALDDFIEYSYDGEGNKISFTDENGHTRTIEYDALNRLTSKTDPLGNKFEFGYDERGNVTSMTDANNHKTSFEYNQLDRLMKKTTPEGDVTTYGYDPVGNLQLVVLPGGNNVVMQYDQLNRLQSVSDAVGLIGEYTYDKNSNRITVEDGNGNITKYFYDPLNRFEKVEDPANNSFLYIYDENSNVVQVTDRKGDISVWSYDKLNRRIAVQDPLGNTTYYSYDPNGNLVGLIDNNNNTTSYLYDDINRLVAEIYDNGDQRSFSYDPAGNLISRTRPNGDIITLEYDEANRLLNRRYPGGVTETFGYDLVGRLISAVNQHATVNMVYDGADRLVSETLNAQTTNYYYTPNTLQRQIEYPGGKQIKESYDARGRLISILDNASPNNPLVEYVYDTGNRLTNKIFENNTNSEFEYDANSNVVKIEHFLNNLVGYEYSHDANNNKIYERNIGQINKSQQFYYDDYGRLIQFKTGTLVGNNIPSPIQDIQYNLDGIHNRTSVSINGSTINYTTNNLNQYSLLSGAMNASLSYDPNGNLLSDGNHVYSFDFENRLDSIDNGSIGQYYYDALGRRILKVSGSDSTFFFYAGLKVIEERASTSGSNTATYIYGIGNEDIEVMERGGNRYYYYTNALGSVTHIADSGGVLVEQYQYDAYGNVSIFNGSGMLQSSSNISNPFLFTGQWYDYESGLYFYKSRYYSPVLGRFIQRDPLGYVDGPSLYEYTFSNPVNWVDPLGLSSSPCDKPWWEEGLDWLQTGLDIGGLIPGIGEIADGINAGIYAARGDWVNAGLSAAAMVPFLGWGATAAKTANKIDNAVDAARAVDNAMDAARGARGADNALDAARGAGRGADDVPTGGRGGGDGGGGADRGGPSSGGNDPHPSTPVGRRNNPIEVQPGTNSPTTINGRDYSGHALDRMQGRGVPPSAVENAIQNGTRSPGNTPGSTVHTDSVNGVRVVTNSDGRVVTVVTSSRGN